MNRPPQLVATCRLCGSSVPAGTLPLDAVAPVLALGGLLSATRERRLRHHVAVAHGGRLAPHGHRVVSQDVVEIRAE